MTSVHTYFCENVLRVDSTSTYDATHVFMENKLVVSNAASLGNYRMRR